MREAHGVPSEVPQDRAKRAKPLDAQHHVVLAQGKRVEVDAERFAIDGDVLWRLPWRRDTVAVRHGDCEVRAGLKANARTLRQFSVDKVVGRSR